jgi:hypothetical protein
MDTERYTFLGSFTAGSGFVLFIVSPQLLQVVPLEMASPGTLT